MVLLEDNPTLQTIKNNINSHILADLQPSAPLPELLLTSRLTASHRPLQDAALTYLEPQLFGAHAWILLTPLLLVLPH